MLWYVGSFAVGMLVGAFSMMFIVGLFMMGDRHGRIE